MLYPNVPLVTHRLVGPKSPSLVSHPEMVEGNRWQYATYNVQAPVKRKFLQYATFRSICQYPCLETQSFHVVLQQIWREITLIMARCYNLQHYIFRAGHWPGTQSLAGKLVAYNTWHRWGKRTNSIEYISCITCNYHFVDAIPTIIKRKQKQVIIIIINSCYYYK